MARNITQSSVAVASYSKQTHWYQIRMYVLTSVLAQEQVMAVQRKQLMSNITRNMTPSAMAR